MVAGRAAGAGAAAAAAAGGGGVQLGKGNGLEGVRVGGGAAKRRRGAQVDKVLCCGVLAQRADQPGVPGVGSGRVGWSGAAGVARWGGDGVARRGQQPRAASPARACLRLSPTTPHSSAAVILPSAAQLTSYTRTHRLPPAVCPPRRARRPAPRRRSAAGAPLQRQPCWRGLAMRAVTPARRACSCCRHRHGPRALAAHQLPWAVPLGVRGCRDAAAAVPRRTGLRARCHASPAGAWAMGARRCPPAAARAAHSGSLGCQLCHAAAGQVASGRWGVGGRMVSQGRCVSSHQRCRRSRSTGF